MSFIHRTIVSVKFDEDITIHELVKLLEEKFLKAKNTYEVSSKHFPKKKQYQLKFYEVEFDFHDPDLYDSDGTPFGHRG
jgi:hypothetical protein